MKNIVGLLVVVVSLVVANVSAEQAGDDAKNVLASYKDIHVTREDLDRFIAFKVPEEGRASVYGSGEKLYQALNNIMITRILAEQAPSDDAEQFQWQAEYQRDVWRSEVVQQLKITKVLSGVDWEAQAKEAYVAENDKYKSAPRVDAAHILIKTDERSREEALTIAKALRERILAGEDFNVLAETESEDPSSKTNRGELGAFAANNMVKPFADAAFKMKEIGSVSEPIESGFGYHLIKLNKILPSERIPFDKVKDHIIKNLHASQAASARERVQIEARSTSGIEINREAMEAMVTKNQ